MRAQLLQFIELVLRYFFPDYVVETFVLNSVPSRLHSEQKMDVSEDTGTLPQPAGKVFL